MVGYGTVDGTVDGTVAATVPCPAVAPKRLIDVEALLVWAYRIECVDCLGEGGDALVPSSWPALGVRVSTSIARERLIESINPDAIVVHRQVLELDVGPKPVGLGCGLSALVIEHARAATRPNWGEGVTARLEMVPSGRFDSYSGKPLPKINWHDRQRKYGWCELSTAGGEAFIALCRDVYRAWWLALWDLAEGLRAGGELSRYRVLSPAAPAEPWALLR